MKKATLVLTLCLLLASTTLMLTGCGTTNEEFITAVENYQVFDKNNSYEMKTVSDFIKKMDSYDGETDRILTFISTSWSEEKLNEDSGLIQKLAQDGGFVYDKNKYYGELSVNVCIASAKDYSTIEDYTYVYLFSLNDDKTIIPEASAMYYGNTFDYKEICTVSIGIQDSMTACVLITDVAIQTHR